MDLFKAMGLALYDDEFLTAVDRILEKSGKKTHNLCENTVHEYSCVRRDVYRNVSSTEERDRILERHKDSYHSIFGCDKYTERTVAIEFACGCVEEYKWNCEEEDFELDDVVWCNEKECCIPNPTSVSEREQIPFMQEVKAEEKCADSCCPSTDCLEGVEDLELCEEDTELIPGEIFRNFADAIKNFKDAFDTFTNSMKPYISEE